MNDPDSTLEQLLEDFAILEVDKRNSQGTEEHWWLGIGSKVKMNPDDLTALIRGAVAAALTSQRQQFEQDIQILNERIQGLTVSVPQVEAFKEIEIVPGKQCDESLDIVKSLPDFDGAEEAYVSWRQAAHTAYKIFENYDGSSRHYQAVAIIRNKIKGSANMALSAYNTVLNFGAIIDRLDFVYQDKRPIHLIEQELSTLRQGGLTVLQFYDEVERKLTLLTNKTNMSCDRDVASKINEKYRMDALRVFISGTRKALSDVLFSARPTDLPSALALAQEAEAHHARYQFAANYARSLEENTKKSENKRRAGDRETPNQSHTANGSQGKNPYYSKKRCGGGSGSSGGGNNGQNQNQDPVQPMEVDPSLRCAQTTQFRPNNGGPPQDQFYGNQTPFQNQAGKRPNNGSARFTGPKLQRVNHLSQDGSEQSQEQYRDLADAQVELTEDQYEQSDQINNFLEKTPCYRS